MPQFTCDLLVRQTSHPTERNSWILRVNKKEVYESPLYESWQELANSVDEFKKAVAGAKFRGSP